MVSATPVQPFGTVFLLTCMTLLTLIRSKTAQECTLWSSLSVTVLRRSWTLRRVAPYKSQTELEHELELELELERYKDTTHGISSAAVTTVG